MQGNDTTVPVQDSHGAEGSYLQWGAIFGGTVVAAAAAGLFATFGAGLGLSTISADRGEGSLTLWLIVTGLWIVISLTASFLAGGYVTGRMRRRFEDAKADEVTTRDGMNGLVMWGLATLIAAWFAAGALGTAVQTAGSAVGGVAQAAGAALGGAAQAVGAAVPEDASEDLSSWFSDTMMRPVLGDEPQAGRTADGVAEDGAAADNGDGGRRAAEPDARAPSSDDLVRQSSAIIANVVRTGEVSEADQAWLVAAVSRTTGLGEEEATQRVNEAVEAAQNAREATTQAIEEAETAARNAAETARISAILTAFLLASATLIAGVAAVAGAVQGGRHRDDNRLFGGFTYR